MHSIPRMRSLLFYPSHSLSKTSLPLLSLPIKFYQIPKFLFKPLPIRPKSHSFTFRSYSVSPVDGRDSSMDARSPSGEIHVIVGPMFAGKTTALLRRVQAESNNGRKVAIIKSNKDTRYGLESIVTHDGAKMPCWALPELSVFPTKLGVEAYDKQENDIGGAQMILKVLDATSTGRAGTLELDVIGIDEAQFFEDLYDFCRTAADHDGKTVIVAGLDGDYLRRSFGSVLDIIPLADSVTKLTARCELCGQRAFFTLRKTEETQTELIGGSDVYMPVCRQHYVNGQIVIEAARVVLENRKLQCDSLL